MTFTYTPVTGADDLTLVRSYVGDVTELTDDSGTPLARGIRSDEEIEMWLETKGDVGGACIAWTQSVLMEINQEADSTQDWLEIDFKAARESYQKMLDEFRNEFDLPSQNSPAASTSTILIWRSDTNMTDPNV